MLTNTEKSETVSTPAIFKRPLRQRESILNLGKPDTCLNQTNYEVQKGHAVYTCFITLLIWSMRLKDAI